jgi:hypothetical protein
MYVYVMYVYVSYLGIHCPPKKSYTTRQSIKALTPQMNHSHRQAYMSPNDWGTMIRQCKHTYFSLFLVRLVLSLGMIRLRRSYDTRFPLLAVRLWRKRWMVVEKDEAYHEDRKC